MSDTSTLNQAAASAAYALKLMKPSAWDSLALAHAEAKKADSILIAPTDILAGIMLNSAAVNANHILKQLGVVRNDETLDKLRANRTVPTTMADILLSNLYGSYRTLVIETVSRAKDKLLQELETLQDQTIPNTEQRANAAVKSLMQCGMSEEDAIDAVRTMRDSTLTELRTINSLIERLTTNLDERSLSISSSSTVFSTWVFNAKKRICPPVKANDVGHIFSKESQQICSLARLSSFQPSIGNEHLLLGLADDKDGPGNAALAAISIDIPMLRWLIQDSLKQK